MLSLRISLLVLPLIAGCHQRTSASTGASAPGSPVARSQGPATRPSEVELEVLELVFRDLLNSPSSGEACFIALGYRDGAWIDAPDPLLRRLEDLHLDLRKPSEARFPKPGEMEPEGNRCTPIRERSTGRRGSIYWVRLAKPTTRRGNSLGRTVGRELRLGQSRRLRARVKRCRVRGRGGANRGAPGRRRLLCSRSARSRPLDPGQVPRRRYSPLGVVTADYPFASSLAR